jgi:hypothetical protein
MAGVPGMKRQIVFAVLKGMLLLIGAVCFVGMSAAFFDGLIGPGWGFRPIYLFLGVAATAATGAGYFITDYIHALTRRLPHPLEQQQSHWEARR